jgi:hypothetical protein
MNVANLELCRELYDLSGWETPYLKTLRQNPNDGIKIIKTYPAYDLGFLLRKTNFGVRPHDEGWKAFYYSKEMTGDSPEDVAVKLAIELFKQGILTKEHSND